MYVMAIVIYSLYVLIHEKRYIGSRLRDQRFEENLLIKCNHKKYAVRKVKICELEAFSSEFKCKYEMFRFMCSCFQINEDPL